MADPDTGGLNMNDEDLEQRQALVARLRSAIGDGVREVWITSEDTGAYGRDLTPRCSLPELMTRMLDAMPDGTMLRVGMTNPPYILQHLEALADEVAVVVGTGVEVAVAAGVAVGVGVSPGPMKAPKARGPAPTGTLPIKVSVAVEITETASVPVLLT